MPTFTVVGVTPTPRVVDGGVVVANGSVELVVVAAEPPPVFDELPHAANKTDIASTTTTPVRRTRRALS
jgi:hypothetical protein